MKIFYILSAYISHRQAGLEYIDCLKKLGHEVSCNYPELLNGEDNNLTLSKNRSCDFACQPVLLEAALAADLLILHEDPAWHDKIFELAPGLEQKRLIIYLPWENATLPAAFIRPLTRAESIWTPSEFCRQAFKRFFKNTQVLPHVVRRPKPTKAALNWANDLLAMHGAKNCCAFLSVMDGLNPRKNLEGLLTAFSLCRKKTSTPVKLVIKQYRAAMPLEGYPDVINITDTLEEAQMAALYASCTAYASAHRAEGWGLGLSTAMSFGKIAIATAYSGNMEFMNEQNSLLVPYTLEHVSQQMGLKIPLFTSEMLWAEPDLGAMSEAMSLVAEGRIEPNLGRQAADIVQRFSPKAIASRLQELI